MSDQAAATKASKKRKASYNWLLWWRIDPTELRDQVDGYDTLKVYQSARGIALLLFIASAILTIAMVELATHDRWAYLDSAIFIGLGIFIYFGHRWAMIGGMALWTLEKLFQLVTMVTTRHIANPIGILIFWALFMHAMLLAYRVEQTRRTSPPVNPSVFD